MIATEEAANKPVAELRLFEGRERSDANIFGETAKVVADALGVQAKLTRKNEFYLTIGSDHIQLAVDALTKAGYNAWQLKEWTELARLAHHVWAWGVMSALLGQR